MSGFEALYEESATVEEREECYQRLINSGTAWRLEGHVGRTAMGLIERGTCMLGEEGCRDFWGNRVPSRNDVRAGTKGSYDFVVEHRGKEHADRMKDLK